MLFSYKLLTAFGLLVTAAVAAPGMESSLTAVEGLEERNIGGYSDLIKITCPGGKHIQSSIACEGRRCTACCGKCCQCIIAPPHYKGSTKTFIEFQPDCTGKCPNHKEDPYEKNKKPKKPSYGGKSKPPQYPKKKPSHYDEEEDDDDEFDFDDFPPKGGKPTKGKGKGKGKGKAKDDEESDDEEE